MGIDFEEVTVSGLAKWYGHTLALAGVDITFQRGSVTLIQGANGSGKSTLLWLLALLSRPNRGEIRYGRYGVDRADELRARIGFVAHQAQLYPGLTGHENLLLAARFHRIPYADKRVSDLATALQLEDYWERPVRTYSRGQAQRVALARASLHEPRLLLLDEPATGLDANASTALIGLIEQQKQEGAIVLIVSHEWELAKRVSDRVLKLERGRVSERNV